MSTAEIARYLIGAVIGCLLGIYLGLNVIDNPRYEKHISALEDKIEQQQEVIDGLVQLFQKENGT